MQIKLITYNIWGGKYLDKLIAFLQTEKAEVVCLQEVTTYSRNVYLEIQRSLDMPGEFVRTFWWRDEGKKKDLGTAILTKLPVLAERKFHYERATTQRVLDGIGKDRFNLPRVLLGQKLKVGSNSLWVFTTHHTITPNGGITEHQLAATRQVKEFLNQFERYILCGDMNTPYGNENYELLSQGLSDLSTPTKPTLHPKIHAVGHLGYHVDYVFTKGEGIEHISTRIPMVDASDHLPVVVELEV